MQFAVNRRRLAYAVGNGWIVGRHIKNAVRSAETMLVSLKRIGTGGEQQLNHLYAILGMCGSGQWCVAKRVLDIGICPGGEEQASRVW